MKEKTSLSTVRKIIADTVDISKDIILNTPLLRCIGSEEVTIENYKGIIEYSDKFIKIKAKSENICISGSELELVCMTDEILNIQGNIDKICFQK